MSISITTGIRGTLSFPQRDWNGEPSSTRFFVLAPGTIISDGSSNATISATDINNLTQLWETFVNGSAGTAEGKALTGATLGMNGVGILSVKNTVETPAGYTVPNTAQRELKWRLTLQDTVTGEFYTYDVPCCNAAILENQNELLPAVQVAALNAFLQGPEIELGESQVNVPLVRSNRGNPLRYVTSSVVGVRYKKN